MNIPQLDGHFWVERDGIIIDPYFKEYDYIRHIQGCKGKQVYLQAPIHVQVVIFYLYRIRDEQFNLDDDFVRKRSPRFANCWINARAEQAKNGGKIVFGSMGWEKPNGEIHYEYGGVNWSVKQHFS